MTHPFPTFSQLLSTSIKTVRARLGMVTLALILIFAGSVVFNVLQAVIATAAGAGPNSELEAIIALPFTLIGMVLGVGVSAFFLQFAIHPTAQVGAMLQRVPGLIFPLMGIYIWTAIRTFVWVPMLLMIPVFFLPQESWLPLFLILGLACLVLLVVFSPRLAFGTIIYVRGKKGVFQSVQQSVDDTRGHWWTVMRMMLLLAAIVFGCAILLGIPALLFMVVVVPAGTAQPAPAMVLVLMLILMCAGILLLYVSQLWQVMTKVFNVRLYDAMLAHPRK